ncbi:DNA/RNA non-specific endonuclease [Psychrobacter lutiphocae]|uniref:DNA/RNA non-specific endonuclease n=1 Tax=Psychrobacter lutiphocae TaxID=540500 RepID=UPI000381EA70|nr:DNA/RNA non-specific endonuclease [Psychrobacter lutiphocae]
MVNNNDQKYNQWSKITGFDLQQIRQTLRIGCGVVIQDVMLARQRVTHQQPVVATAERRVRNQQKLRSYIVKRQCVWAVSLLVTSCWWSVTAFGADFSQCADNFYAGTAPDYIDSKLLNKSVPLCFNGFATLYSGLSRTPLWSAEYLTRERLFLAEEIPREDSFHSESRLPQSMRAELSDYKGTGYDRGHLAPNGDMANRQQQYDSFSLANIVPQHPRNNRYSWRNIESVTRYLTKHYGEVYVVTGVAFRGKQVTQLNGRVLVPSHMFKALYVPQTQEAGVYYSPNDDSDRVEIISIDELALRSGIDVFPKISEQAKARAMPLATSISEMPEIGRDYSASQRQSASEREASKRNPSDNKHTEGQDEEPLWYLILIEVLRWFVDNFLHKQ